MTEITTSTHPYRQNIPVQAPYSESNAGSESGTDGAQTLSNYQEPPSLRSSERSNSYQQISTLMDISPSTSFSTPSTGGSSNFQALNIIKSRDGPPNVFNNVYSNPQRSISVDLSHMYLANNNGIQFTQMNESVADLSHQMISQYLGENANEILVPRLKTIEMYRENVKKSKDPDVLFQYAQYTLQTALTMDDSTSKSLKSDVLANEPNESSISDIDLKKQFLKEAQYYLKKLSVKGYKDAQYLLADSYASGAFGKVNDKEAFCLFQSSAKHGHIESAYRTAICFEYGLGTARDSRKCIEFLKFAASRNHPAAMLKLGLYSFYGKMGLSQDVNTKQNGIKWLSRASARANELICAAPYELGKIYETGFLDIIIPDQSYAMELYIQSATLGYAPAATLLGKIYETGNDIVPQDTSLSAHYYTQAALKGDPDAMLGLCAWYLVGAEPVFEKDEREAFQWALRAAKKGLPKAQFTIGHFFENGKGCNVDKESAWKWYEKAAKSNYPRANKKINQNMNKSKSGSTFNLSSSKNSSDDLKPTLNVPKIKLTSTQLDISDLGPRILESPSIIPDQTDINPSLSSLPTPSFKLNSSSEQVSVNNSNQNLAFDGSYGSKSVEKLASKKSSSGLKPKSFEDSDTDDKKNCIVM